MTVHFHLRFYTRPGQSLFVIGNRENLGNFDAGRAFPLEYASGEFWQGEIVLEEPVRSLQYRYLLKNEDGTITQEWGDDRIVENISDEDGLRLIDTWNHAGEFENAFFTAPFQKVLLPKPGKAAKTKSPAKSTHRFRVKAPLLREDETLILSGDSAALTDWSETKPVKMRRDGNWWAADVRIEAGSPPIAYKYGVWDRKKKTFRGFEQGPNRLLPGDGLQSVKTVVHDGFIHLPNDTWRGAGVSIPVFSLRSKDSFGVGEFTDLKLFADWAAKTGLRLIQLLPVNDTCAAWDWEDSYPYAAISAFALHPIYLNLAEVAGKKHASILKPFRQKQKELNALPDLDYPETIRIKMTMAEELYAALRDEWQQDPGYAPFFEANKHWLVPYAAFCYLRDSNDTPDSGKWKTYRKYSRETVARLAAPGSKAYDDIAFYYFLQFQLHRQLSEAAAYAHEQGIVIKGDIPIGIFRHSCDAWMAPSLYHMDMQAGAPPDSFAVKGQNWGFPTYNWPQMASDGFAWWKSRFEQMSAYFDAFRIDHILGFFRIWSIPWAQTEGVMGFFDPALTVHRDEFAQRGIWFDRDRYTRPFINDAVLWEYFGPLSEEIKATYFLPPSQNIYPFREAFDTQRKIEEHFAALPEAERNETVRQGLLRAIANVILLETPDPDEFHFAVSMDQTPSFRYLDWNLQQQLRVLFVNYFYERQDHFWRARGLEKLPVLKRSTNMLICGEDLGTVSPCVPQVMAQLGILGLEVQRMPKTSDREFFHPADAPYLSVVTPSTHDMSTIRGWWEEDPAKTQRFYNNTMGQLGSAPFYCEPWINRAIVIQHLYSPAMWAIFQLQDLMGMSATLRRENPHDERINQPADPKNHWKYRMHGFLEDLLKEKAFNRDLEDLVKASGRA